MKAIFDHSDREASNIRTFWFRPSWPTNYTPGQYTELTLPITNPDERGDKHWFTLSSAPGQELVSITTKYAGDDKSSSFKKCLFHDLKPGDEVDLAEPEGDFVLPDDASKPLVFVAGGIGLTPFHSMMEWLAANNQRRNITFLYAVRTETEIIFRNTFQRAGIEPTIVVSEPSDAWTGEHGQLNAKRILELAKPANDALIYLSGPEPMVMALQKDLIGQGIAADRIMTDDFPGYAII